MMFFDWVLEEPDQEDSIENLVYLFLLNWKHASLTHRRFGLNRIIIMNPDRADLQFYPGRSNQFQAGFGCRQCGFRSR